MEKKQHDLCLEILRRFNAAGILNDFIVIGSWCVYFYKDYFSDIPYVDRMALRTRDIDFLIDKPAKIKQVVDVPELLKDLGFVTIFKGDKGYIKLDHPDLILEFLVTEKGKGIDRPYKIPALSINATALRFLDFLSSNTIKVKVDDFVLTLPHPINFALHKLIISERRANEEKALKDRNAAIEVLRALIIKGEAAAIKNTFNSMVTGWQKKVIKGLGETKEKEILGLQLNKRQ